MRIFVDRLADRCCPKAPRHTEVNKESSPALEPNNQILAATIDRCDALAFDLGRHEIGRERTHETGIENGRLRDPSPDEDRCDLSAHGLDLGKLRHCASVATWPIWSGG